MDFGMDLLEFRAKYNLTQKEVSKIIGVSVNMVHRYETGARNPTAKNKIVFENKMKEWESKK